MQQAKVKVKQPNSQNYRDLLVWQKSLDLVEETYRLTKKFPREEVYALQNQIRRAAVSVPSNIAEGQGRGTAVEFKRFLHISLGSLAELDTQLEIAVRLSYLQKDETKEVEKLATEVRKMLFGLINSLK